MWLSMIMFCLLFGFVCAVLLAVRLLLRRRVTRSSIHTWGSSQISAEPSVRCTLRLEHTDPALVSPLQLLIRYIRCKPMGCVAPTLCPKQ